MPLKNQVLRIFALWFDKRMDKSRMVSFSNGYTFQMSLYLVALA